MATLLSLENVTVNYGAVEALNNVTLNVSQGQVVSLIGSNGAGKTTCLKSILGLNTCKKGRVMFDGQDITSLSTERRVKLGIGCSPEGRRVFTDQTVTDNLLLGAYVFRGNHRQVKEDIARIMDQFPILKEKANQLAATLSGGQQQILAIARALMSRPRLLLLDEPSLGLAPILIREVYELVKEANRQGTTILLIEQYASYALGVSQVGYVLEHGTIKAHGRVEDLKQNPIVIEAYLGGT